VQKVTAEAAEMIMMMTIMKDTRIMVITKMDIMKTMAMMIMMDTVDIIKRNIGLPDRLIRLGIAIVLFFFAYWKMSWILLIFALFTLFEALKGWCILYQLLGKNSCSMNLSN
jgi:hypothetical protein